MKRVLPFFLVLAMLVLAAVSYSFITPEDTVVSKTEAKAVTWYSWEEAVALSEKNPKKMFIDVYTDWCGWCKKMDKATFNNPKVAAYLNKHFYPVKLNAEMKEDVVYKGHTFKYMPNGRRGVHTLAASLLNNQMSYPSCVAMSEEMHRITIIPGYRDAKGMMSILQYIAEEKYKTMTFDEFESSKE